MSRFENAQLDFLLAGACVGGLFALLIFGFMKGAVFRTPVLWARLVLLFTLGFFVGVVACGVDVTHVLAEGLLELVQRSLEKGMTEWDRQHDSSKRT